MPTQVHKLHRNNRRYHLGDYPAPGFDAAVIDWYNRVIANGGAAPSTNTLNALNTFSGSLRQNSLFSKFFMLNFVAPDNLIASQTPFIKVKGSDPWTNHNFVGGDLTVNGLAGNGSTKYLDTGSAPSTDIPTAFDFGITTLMYDAAAETVFDFGAGNSPFTEGYDSLHTTTQVEADMSYNGGTGRDAANAASFRGLISANRSANNVMHLYLWSDFLGISGSDALLSATTVDGRASVTATMITHGINLAGTPTLLSSHRYSLFSTHTHFTLTDATNFQAAYKTLRTTLGGGWI